MFLEENGPDYVELNLVDQKSALEAFNTSINADQLMLRLTALAGHPLTPGKTIIFIDEIQEADDAVTPIRFPVSDTPYRFIFSGSLPGIKMKDIRSVPVGSVTMMQMYPLDFEEYLNAMSVSLVIIEHLKSCFENRTPVDEIVHEQLMSVFRLYHFNLGGVIHMIMFFHRRKETPFTKIQLDISHLI